MLRCAVLFVLLSCVVAAAPLLAMPGPGPGMPFGGDDAGCVPATRDQLRCSEKVGKAVAKLVGAVTKCHMRQADARFSTVVSGRPRSLDEEACEGTARAKLDQTLAALAANGRCTDAAVAAAAAHVDVLLADAGEPGSLDALNGAFYCDPTTGIAIDPTGEDAGVVPSTDGNLRCGDQVGRLIAKLEGDVVKCHAKAAKLGLALADPPFDEEGCEAKAVAKLDRTTARLVARGGCPPCLDATAQHALAVDAVARRDGANGSVHPCPDLVLHLGALEVDRPTLVTLGVRLLVSGDADHDAVVSVRYHVVGAPAWKDALPLFRVRPETVDGRSVPEQFAGSIFDLRPATTYEIELHAIDADGPVDETRTVTATTRSVPADPATPNVRPVASAAGLVSALASAAPGDVIALADGVYNGQFAILASGTAANPIVIRGASTNGTILDGGGCEGCNVLEAYGSFVHVERLTLRSATRGLRFQTAGAEGNVVRRVWIHDVTLGIGSREDQRDFYLCDNVLEGPLVWPHVYRDDAGAFADDDGIHVEGDGHVVCHNRIVGFGDAMKTEQDGARALDFYGNEVLSAYDNGVELDVSEGNTRVFRNRFTNTYSPISFQPIYGGPAYALRNVVVNVADEQMKFHGLGGGSGPSGVLVYHNTFVSPAIALDGRDVGDEPPVRDREQPLRRTFDARRHAHGRLDRPDRRRTVRLRRLLPGRRLSLQSARVGAGELRRFRGAPGGGHRDPRRAARPADLRERTQRSRELHRDVAAAGRDARPGVERGRRRPGAAEPQRRIHRRRTRPRRARARLPAADLRRPAGRHRRDQRALRLRLVALRGASSPPGAPARRTARRSDIRA